jgi:glycosyltransferase involved in cell wall biosynthesis
MEPLVTIGVPCFNSAQWLKGAIDSALVQDWPAVEVIVADNGSTDSTRDILRDFGDSIRVIFAGHRGANHARNAILKEARGEWIQYLDADDLLLPEKISRQFAESEDGRDCDVIYSPVWIEEKGERRKSELISSRDIFSQWIAWQLPQTGGCLWRKQALERLGGWNEAMPCCQEHELYLRALQAGIRFRYTPTPNAVYRIWSDESLCRRDPRKVITIRTDLIDRLLAWLKAQGLWTEKHNAAAAQACFEMARSLAQLNLAEAGAYHDARKRENLIRLNGPAAPLPYRLSYSLLGFSGAERLARSLR